MPDLDNCEYTNDNDDPSQLIVGVTKTVSKLPPSRPGPGVYISYATRTWVSRGKIKPGSSSILQQTPLASSRSRISFVILGVILSLLLLLCSVLFVYRYDEINAWFKINEWQSWIKDWIARIQQQPWIKEWLIAIHQQLDYAMVTWNVQVNRIQHLIKAYIEDDELLYDRLVSRTTHLGHQSRQWLDTLVAGTYQFRDHVCREMTLWFRKTEQVIQEQVSAWICGDKSTLFLQDDIVEIAEIDLNDV